MSACLSRGDLEVVVAQRRQASDEHNVSEGRGLVERLLHCSRTSPIGWIYLVRAGSGAIKIGKAGSFFSVRRQLGYARTYVDSGIAEVKLIHGGHPMESTFHRRLSSERVRLNSLIASGGTYASEWFRGELADALMRRISRGEVCEGCHWQQRGLFGQGSLFGVAS